MTIKVAKEKVLLSPLEKEITEDGFIIPKEQDEKKQPEVAIVREIGQGALPVSLKKGDKIAYAKYMGSRLAYRGYDYIVVDFKDILFVITE